MRRRTGFLLAIALAAGTPRAESSGILLSSPGEGLSRVVRYAALLVHAQGREELSVTVAFEGGAPAAWLLPIAGASRVFPGVPAAAESVSRRVAFSEFPSFTAGGHRCMVSWLTETGGAPWVEARVFPSSDAPSLAPWLRQHRLRLPPGGRERLLAWWDRGWSVAALRFPPGPAPEGGGVLGPVRFRFATDRPSWPGLEDPESSAVSVVVRVVSDAYWQPRALEGALELGLTQSLPPGVDPGGAFPELAGERARLLIWTLQGPFPEGLAFEPYDPVAGLRDPAARRRAQAAAVCGDTRAPGCEAPLAALLLREESTWVIRQVFWPLARIGGTQAESAIAPWAYSEHPDLQLEALRALDALESGEGRVACRALVEEEEEQRRQETARADSLRREGVLVVTTSTLNEMQGITRRDVLRYCREVLARDEGTGPR